MARPKLANPGASDCEWMHVLFTPDTTTVEFHETPREAEDAAQACLTWSTSVYVAQVRKQGEHHERSNAKAVTVVVQLDHETRRAIARYNGSRSREAISSTLSMLLAGVLQDLRDNCKKATPEPEIHDEVTKNGARP